MITKVEIAEKVVTDTSINVIVECNRYLDNILIEQCSRSPFSFPLETTDDQIIQSISDNEYKRYF